MNILILIVKHYSGTKENTVHPVLHSAIPEYTKKDAWFNLRVWQLKLAHLRVYDHVCEGKYFETYRYTWLRNHSTFH